MTAITHHLMRIQAELRETESNAALFHEQSKTRPNVLQPFVAHFAPDMLPQISRRAYKSYRLAKQTALAEPQTLPVYLDDLILQRRSVRKFAARSVEVDDLATQLGLGYRIVGERFRPIPSGGALYPLEIYPIALNVADLADGFYHYNPHHHALELLSSAPPLPALENIFLPDTLPADVAYLFAICGVLPRNRFKYGDLGYRLMLLEAGHLAQNIILVAEAQGLATLPICGFYDDRMHDYLAVDGVDEVCLYVIAIGKTDQKSNLHT